MHIATMADRGGTLAPCDKLKAHCTLIDVHPANLPRVLVALSLLGRILDTRRNSDTACGIELLATLFYVYTAMVMPSYCHKMYAPLHAILTIADRPVDLWTPLRPRR